METYNIRAREPTVLDGQSHWTLRPGDLMLSFKVRLSVRLLTVNDLDRVTG